MASLKEKTVKGVVWSSVDRFFSQGIQFIFSILIARLLLPSDYGTVAMLNIFLAISQTFIDSGFGTALIRKIDRTEEDFSTVFYFNIAAALAFYGILWFTAPYIADFYDIPLLKDITRVVALTLVFGSFSGIQTFHCDRLQVTGHHFNNSDIGGGCLGIMDGVQRIWSMGLGHAVGGFLPVENHIAVGFCKVDAEAGVFMEVV